METKQNLLNRIKEIENQMSLLADDPSDGRYQTNEAINTSLFNARSATNQAIFRLLQASDLNFDETQIS